MRVFGVLGAGFYFFYENSAIAAILKIYLKAEATTEKIRWPQTDSLFYYEIIWLAERTLARLILDHIHHGLYEGMSSFENRCLQLRFINQNLI